MRRVRKLVVEVAEGEVSVVKLWLRAEQYRENEIVGLYDQPTDEVTRRTITMAEIEQIPGTFGDPVRVVQTLPGAARSPFSTGLLIIRGADPEDSGVYIDGIRVPIIYHITGATSVISPDIIESVDYLPGGYGVQYGRTMGGTVDVKTKSDIEPGHRVADVLEWFPATEPVFLEFGFSAIKHAVFRRTLARQVSLAQACKMHNVDAGQFVAALTVLVIYGLVVTEVVAVASGHLAVWRIVPTWCLQALLLGLFAGAYHLPALQRGRAA